MELSNDIPKFIFAFEMNNYQLYQALNQVEWTSAQAFRVLEFYPWLSKYVKQKTDLRKSRIANNCVELSVGRSSK